MKQPGQLAFGILFGAFDAVPFLAALAFIVLANVQDDRPGSLTAFSDVTFHFFPAAFSLDFRMAQAGPQTFFLWVLLSGVVSIGFPQISHGLYVFLLVRA